MPDDVKSLASLNFIVPRPELVGETSAHNDGFDYVSSRQVVLRFALCVLPARCHRYFAVILFASLLCGVSEILEEARNALDSRALCSLF